MHRTPALMLGWIVALALGCGAEQVDPTESARLVFLSQEHSTEAGACSAPIVLGLQDDRGMAVPAGHAFEVVVETAQGEPLELYGSTGCATPLAQLTFPAGATQTSLHLRSTIAGSRMLRAASTWSVATQTQTVHAGHAASVIIQPIANTRVGVTFVATAQAVDAFGNPINELLRMYFEPSVPWSCTGGCGRSSTALFEDGNFRANLSVDRAAAQSASFISPPRERTDPAQGPRRARHVCDPAPYA